MQVHVTGMVPDDGIWIHDTLVFKMSCVIVWAMASVPVACAEDRRGVRSATSMVELIAHA
jgi:hypothetical protein